MATISAIVDHWINSFKERNISSDTLYSKVVDPDSYCIEDEQCREAVLHLLRDSKSPWKIREDWSDEAVKLREMIATCSVKRFTADFFYSFIRSLRIVDKQVSALDDTCKLFFNLEELILSGNYLTDVPPEMLPSSLKLLELNSNEISFRNSSGLCLAKGIRGLKHLGLGRNAVNDLSWFKPNIWSRLASLDLSLNNLANFSEILSKVVHLPCLKALVFAGNPIALLPGYRTGIVNCLGHLHILDDVPIAADEMLNAMPIATAIDESNTSVSVFSHSQVQMRCTSPITGLPQPPIVEATQQPADWFFRVELTAPAAIFEDSITIFNQPSDSLVEATAGGLVQKKGQGAGERLNPCIERGLADNTTRICSPGLRHQPSLALGSLFQPIIDTVALEKLRDSLQDSAFKVSVVLVVRSIVTPENSRPTSAKKGKADKDHKDDKDLKAGKHQKKQGNIDPGTITTLSRTVLAEATLNTTTMVKGSSSTISVKINVPASALPTVEMEPRPPSPKGKVQKRGDLKSPKDKKSPRSDKSPPPPGPSKGGKQTTAQAQQSQEPPPPPPPDLQASFAFDIFKVRTVNDIQKWALVNSNTTSILAMPE